MTVEHRFDEPGDQSEFPIGMRVLAVDDEPTCLLLLETLLRRCQYHVTTTNQAATALKMLRENKDKFDLVISDVHMPDMDGFKLLELVGLEMDLPVIMLSGNDDPRLVMKGITHGACDYLLKPIRLEELKNIWQHVIRRKKLESKGKRNSKKPHNGSTEGGHEWTGGLNKKRKDQNEDEVDEHDENAQENEDLSTQKKPRVVWSVELHHKFVAAVHQLGIDKAVPKRILELMNEENLSRENVASHLQKYRLYLRKFSDVASQQANMVAAFGNTIDSNYLRMLSLNGLGNYNTLSGSHIQNGTFNTFSQKGTVGRLNSPAGLGVRGLSSSSSGIAQVQLAHSQNTTFSNTDMDKLPPVILQENQNENILQGMPLSIDFEPIKDYTNAITMGFSASGRLSDTKLPIIGSQQNSFFGASNNPLKGTFSSDLTSHSPIDVRCSENWSNAVQSSGMQYLNVPFKQSALSSNSFKDSTSQMNQLIGNQTAPHMAGSMPQKMEYTPIQGWNNQKLSFSNRSNACGLVNSINFGNTYSLDQSLDAKITSFRGNVEFNLMGQPNFDYSLHMQHNVMGNSAMNITVHSNQGQGQPLGGHSYNNFGSLEDLVSAVMKKEQKKTTKMEEDFGSDEFSMETFR